MKALLKSTNPNILVNILNGDASTLVCENFPEDFRGWVYLYCTKQKPYLYKWYNNGKTIYECENIGNVFKNDNLNGSVVCRFYCDEIRPNTWTNCLQGSCLSYEQIKEHMKGKDFVSVHISQLEIFDKPKELNEFYKAFKNKYCKSMFSSETHKENGAIVQPTKYGYEYCYPLTQAPKNYCYVEDFE